MTQTRLKFVDLLRGGALLVMIETHVFNTFLLPQLQVSNWYQALTFINGLVAPSFLFVSGFVFIIASRRKIESFRTFGPEFWRQLRRIGLIWGIGYVLHLPRHSFTDILAEATPQQWQNFFQVDILQCIAAGLLFVFISVIFINSEQTCRRWLLLAGVAMVLMSPILESVDVALHVPAPVAAYLNHQISPLFPLFPWAAYLILGAAVSLRYLEKSAAGQEDVFMKRTVWIGLGLITLPYLLHWLGVRDSLFTLGWRASPLFFAVRLGCVLLLLAACRYYEQKRSVGRSFVLDTSRESLFVYTAHLVVIYSLSWQKKSLAKVYGGSLGPVECATATVALMLLMALGAKAWGGFKRRSPLASRWVFYGFVVVLGFLFFFGQWLKQAIISSQ